MSSQVGFSVAVRVHRWSSLLCTLVLLLACLTGLPLIFEDELEATAPVPVVAGAAAPHSALSLDALVTRAARGGFVQFVFWEDERADLIGLGLARRPNAPLTEVQRVLIDPRSAQPVGETSEASPALTTLADLHRNLLMGDVGDIVLSVTALLFVVSTVSGVCLYAPFMRRLAFGTIRVASRSRSWLDLHNLLGIATAAWALVVGATGLMNTLEGALFGAWQRELLPSLEATVTTAAPSDAAGGASLQGAVEAARRALPEMQVTSLGLAGTAYGTPHHHLIWMHGTTPLTQRLFATVLVDAVSGTVARAESLPWYLRALEISRPLHFGDYGGLPMKVLWACFDLVLIAILSTGVYLWFSKARRAPVARSTPIGAEPAR